MRKLWVLLLAATAALSAQTTVSDNVNVSQGLSVTSIGIAWPSFVSSDGTSLSAGSTSVAVRWDGNFTVALYPTLSTTTVYTVTYTLASGATKTDYWNVPASAAPVNIRQCHPRVETVLTSDQSRTSVTGGGGGTGSTGSSGGTGPFLLSGQTSNSPPATPLAGNQTLFFPALGGPEGIDSTGTVYQMLAASSLLCGANMVMSGPASGNTTVAPTCRLLTAADTPSIINPGGGLNIYSGTAYNGSLTGPYLFGNSATGSVFLSSGSGGVIAFNWNSGGTSNALRFGNENPTSPVSLFDLYFGAVNSSYASAEPTIRVNSGVMIVNGTGSAPLRFNYDAGTGGAVYYDGAGNTTATINGSGNATFGGTSDLATTTYKLYANGLAHATTYESSVSTVTASATPTFDLSLGDLKLTLAQNVTSSTFANIRQGRANRLEVCQPGSGGPYTFAAPATAANFPTITTTAGACTMVALQSFDGTSEIASGGTTGGGSSAFSALTSATNTTAAMVVGTGASLSASGSGTIAATTAAALASAPTACSGGQYATGVGANGNAICSTPSGTGGSGASFGTVTYSATPNFDFSTGTFLRITLTGNVTSWTVSNLSAGTIYTIDWVQDATGSRTVAGAPATVHGMFTPGTTASLHNVQSYVTDGTNLLATTAGVVNQ